MNRSHSLSRILRIFYFLSVFFCFFQSSAGAEDALQFILKDAVWRHPDKDRLPAYWESVRAQGYTGVALEVVDSSGLLYCFSPTLAALGWEQQPDRFGPMLKALPDRDEPKSRLKIFVDLSHFSRQAAGFGEWPKALRRPGPEDAGQVAADLQDYYTYDELLVTPVSAEVQSIFYRAARGLRKKLNLFAESPQFDRLLKPSSDKKSDREWQHRFVTQDTLTYPLKADENAAAPNFALGDLVFAVARGQGKEAWAGCGAGTEGAEGFEHNAMVYRSAQYAPRGFVVLPTGANGYIYESDRFDFGRQVQPDIVRFRALALDQGPVRTPVANLVLGAQAKSSVGAALPFFIEPVMNALLANGYEVRVTFNELLPKADLYYVASEDWLSDLPFFRKLINLLDERKSRFYGPVILHPTDEIGDRGPWKELRAFFKIPESETGWMDEIPEAVIERGRKIAWRGTVPGRRGMTSIRSKAVRSNYGDVMLSQNFQSRDMALILRNGTRYLVNGNSLHLEAAYFLSKMMQDALQAPALAYITSGRLRTAALALADTSVQLKVPVLDAAAEWTITVFDAAGHRVQEETVPGRDVLKLNLKAGDLALVKQTYH